MDKFENAKRKKNSKMDFLKQQICFCKKNKFVFQKHKFAVINKSKFVF